MSHAIQIYRSGGALQGERLLQICIGGSIVLHVLAMLYAPRVEPPVVPPAMFTATLRAAPVPVPVTPAPVAPPAPIARREKTPPPPPPPVVTPEPPVPVVKPLPAAAPAASVALAPAPATLMPATPVPSAPAPEAKSAAVFSETKDAPRAAPAAALPISAGPSDTDLINVYQNQLVPVVEKYRRYPNDAVQNNWVGKALVSIRIGSDGKLKGAPEITTSSGHEILDAEARTALNKAKSFVPIPAGLAGKEFVARMWIVFELKTK